MPRIVTHIRLRLARLLAPHEATVVWPRGEPLPGDGPLRFAWDRQMVRAARRKQDALARAIFERTGGRVVAGPFAGMRFVAESSWGDLAAKLLGCYEEELHPAIERGLGRGWDRIINVGCGEGYYAVGFALRQPAAPVLAYDVDPRAQRLTAELARRNGVADRVEVGGVASREVLGRALKGATHPFLLIDCEGAEIELLDPGHLPALRHADLIIECHDFLDRSITDRLRARFATTHTCEQVREQSRDPRAIALLAEMGCLDAALLLCEFRPERMHWLVLERRQPSES